MAEIAPKITYLAYRSGSAVANVLPGPVAYALASGLGKVMARKMRGRRAMLERHLRRALGRDATDDDVGRAFRSYAHYWLESFRLASMTRDDLEARMSWEGLARVDEALAGGKGVIMALPHLGGWDFGGAWLAAVGYAPTVVVEGVEPPALFEWFVEMRRAAGMTVVAHGPDASRGVLGALRRNELVGLLSDRDLARTGAEVEFFGERTTLPAGPATLALRSGAPLLPCAIYLEPRGGRHYGIVRPPIDLTRNGSLREDVNRITQDLARELEGLIRRAPEQWHLMQPNWPSDFSLATSR